MVTFDVEISPKFSMYDHKRPPEYKTEEKGDSFSEFINRHCGGEQNLFQPVNGQSALEYAGLNGAQSISQSLSGIQRNRYFLNYIIWSI